MANSVLSTAENLLQSIRDQVRNLYELVDPIQAGFSFKARPSTAEIFSKVCSCV